MMHALDHVFDCVLDNFNHLKNINSFEDAYKSVTLRVTGAVLLTAFVVWVSTGSIRSSKSSTRSSTKSRRRKKNKKPKQPKEMSPEESISHVLAKFNNEYEPGFNNLLQNYEPEQEKSQYQRTFYNEMLLHLLLDLDAIQLTSLEGERKEAARLQRKAAIKKIQLELKKLDQLH